MNDKKIVEKWGEYIPHKNEIEKDIILVDYCNPNIGCMTKCYFLDRNKIFGSVKIKDHLYLDGIFINRKKPYSLIFQYSKKEFNKLWFSYNTTKLMNVYKTDDTKEPKIKDNFIKDKPINRDGDYTALFVNKFIRCYAIDRVFKHYPPLPENKDKTVRDLFKKRL